MLTLEATQTIQKRIKLSTGVELSYVEQGDPAGVPVIFLHGFTDSWHSFKLALPHLPQSLHAFALSHRGHGDADRPEAGYRPQDFAADVAAFMDALNLGPAVIAGHSMSSAIAQRFALDYPERLLGLVLIGAFAAYQDKPMLLEFQEVISQLEDPIDPGFVREFQESTVGKPVPPAFLDTIVQESLKVPARVWKAALRALLENELSSERENIKTRTLIMWGDQDAYCPRADQEALLATIEGSQLLVYPGIGHNPHWEEPALFTADLVAFIKDLNS